MFYQYSEPESCSKFDKGQNLSYTKPGYFSELQITYLKYLVRRK